MLVAHGSKRRGGSNPTLLRHAERMRARGIFAEVRAAALYGTPAAETALEALTTPKVYLVPLLMCAGRTASKVVPQAFALTGTATVRGGQELLLCPPTGTQPGLQRLILARALSRAQTEGATPSATSLLLISHGSRLDPASHRTTSDLAAALRVQGVFRDVRIALLDEPPFLVDVLQQLDAPTIAVGLFAAEGRHAGIDVPEAIDQYGRNQVYDLGAIGEDPAVCELVLEAVAATDRQQKSVTLTA